MIDHPTVAAFYEKLRDLNNAAYAAIRASTDTTLLPFVDRQALRLIAKETDRLVEQGEDSGKRTSAIQRMTDE